MNKYCIVGKIKKEYIEEYKDKHINIHLGPHRELLEVIKSSGVKEEAVFMYENLAIIFFEADDLDKAYEIQGRTEIASEWNAVMAPMFDSDYEFNNADSLQTLEKVFDLNEQLSGKLIR